MIAIYLTLGMAFWLAVGIAVALVLGEVIATADEHEHADDTDETDRFEAWA